MARIVTLRTVRRGWIFVIHQEVELTGIVPGKEKKE